MNKFIERFAAGLAGVLTGFDRVVFRGTLRRRRYLQGMMGYLWEQQVLLKDFGSSSSHNFGFAVLQAKANSREAGILFDLFGQLF